MPITEADVMNMAMIVEKRIGRAIEELGWVELLTLAQNVLGHNNPATIEFKDVLENWDGDF